jgi:hypothetical protein
MALYNISLEQFTSVNSSFFHQIWLIDSFDRTDFVENIP